MDSLFVCLLLFVQLQIQLVLMVRCAWLLVVCGWRVVWKCAGTTAGGLFAMRVLTVQLLKLCVSSWASRETVSLHKAMHNYVG